MHRLLYRDGLTLRRRPRQASPRSPRRRRRRPTTSRLMRRLPRRGDARHRALSLDRAMNPDAPRFAMVAGEASGDLLAGSLLAGLRARWPALVGRRHRRAADGRARLRGLVAARQARGARLRRGAAPLPRDRSASATALGERLLADQPDAFIGVDAPDFNLGAREHAEGARASRPIHFVSPSIWAWRGKRIEKIGRATDLVLCIFPFEPEIYAQAQHRRRRTSATRWPARSRSRCRARPRRAALGIGADETLVALLPGSRRSEIEYIAPRLFGAAAELQPRRGRACASSFPVVPGLRDADRGAARSSRARCRDHAARRPGSHEALAACDVAARRQRHGDARGGAVQAADGRRLRDALRSAGRWAS